MLKQKQKITYLIYRIHTFKLNPDHSQCYTFLDKTRNLLRTKKNLVSPKAKFPDLVGSTGLDSVKAFTVDYSADGSTTADVELGTGKNIHKDPC